MASTQLQHVRRLHLQAAKYSTPSIVGRLKSLVGIRESSVGLENDKSKNNASIDVQGEFVFDDVTRRISAVVSQSLARTENWEQLPLPDLTSKLKLLQGCHKEFGIIPPNNIVNESKTVQDFVQYYSTLRKPEIIPEVFKFEEKKLPPNLTFEPNLPFRPAKKKL